MHTSLGHGPIACSWLNCWIVDRARKSRRSQDLYRGPCMFFLDGGWHGKNRLRSCSQFHRFVRFGNQLLYKIIMNSPWRVSPAHQWHTAKIPCLSLLRKIVGSYQTAMTRYWSGHLRCINLLRGETFSFLYLFFTWFSCLFWLHSRLFVGCEGWYM